MVVAGVGERRIADHRRAVGVHRPQPLENLPVRGWLYPLIRARLVDEKRREQRRAGPAEAVARDVEHFQAMLWRFGLWGTRLARGPTSRRSHPAVTGRS